MDTRQRTIVKALGWQVIGLSVMAVVGAILTGSVALGGTLALVNTTLGFLTYVIYERFWAGIAWGRA